MQAGPVVAVAKEVENKERAIVVYNPPSYLQLLKFVISFTGVTSLWRPLKGGKHWNVILEGDEEKGPLILSALPIKKPYWAFWNLWGWLDWGDHHLKLMAESQQYGHPLGLVISMNLGWEREGIGLLDFPVTAEDWKALEVEYYPFDMEDFTNNISLFDLKMLVDKIHDARTKGIAMPNTDQRAKGVVTHCKAGVARSMVVEFAYLCFHEGMLLEEAEALLRSCRPEVAISEGKRQLVRNFLHEYTEENNKIIPFSVKGNEIIISPAYQQYCQTPKVEEMVSEDSVSEIVKDTLSDGIAALSLEGGPEDKRDLSQKPTHRRMHSY